jgi:hypothetical protein
VQLHDAVQPLFDKSGSSPRSATCSSAVRPAVGRLPDHRAHRGARLDRRQLGRFVGRKEKDPEKTVLKTNIEAAREVARQLRLRDVGGIIVCDFIDMEVQANRDRVLQELRSTSRATAPAPRRTPSASSA